MKTKNKSFYIFKIFSLFGIWLICTSYFAVNLIKPKDKINLSQQGLTSIPDFVFENPENIRVLNLYGNHLDSLDDRIGTMVNLEKLYLGKNDLIKLSSQLVKLKKLKLLSLQYNELDTLENYIGELENLEQLWLDRNRLKYLPDSLGKLKKLCVLKLNFNELVALPKNIGSCTDLGFLYLERNFLTEIPESIGELNKLKELNLLRAGNLVQLPESICKLRFLEYLTIDNYIVIPTCLLTQKTNRLNIIVRKP